MRTLSMTLFAALVAVPALAGQPALHGVLPTAGAADAYAQLAAPRTLAAMAPRAVTVETRATPAPALGGVLASAGARGAYAASTVSLTAVMRAALVTR